jgi:hypothetical protein
MLHEMEVSISLPMSPTMYLYPFAKSAVHLAHYGCPVMFSKRKGNTSRKDIFKRLDRRAHARNMYST